MNGFIPSAFLSLLKKKKNKLTLEICGSTRLSSHRSTANFDNVITKLIMYSRTDTYWKIDVNLLNSLSLPIFSSTYEFYASHIYPEALQY